MTVRTVWRSVRHLFGVNALFLSLGVLAAIAVVLTLAWLMYHAGGSR